MISIPNYTIEKEIGRGGMATVYLAIQDKLKRKVALKVMTPEMAKDDNFKKSFMSEATIIASLDHPNIVRIYDVEIVDDSTLYMAMEYLSGNTLKEKLLNGRMSFPKALKVIGEISKGLIHAHEKGYIHRDIKPGNILFRGDGTAVLTDFGIAKLQDTSGELTRMGFTMGTLQYMSPEQVITTDLDQRSDIYSLGLVFYEMLTGFKAFKAETTVQAIHQHTTVPPPELENEYSYLQNVLDKVLAKDPKNRYQNVNEFVTAISTASEDDKTVIYQVRNEKDEENDKTRIFTPKTEPEVVSIAKKTKSPIFPIVIGGVFLVGGAFFTAYKYLDFDKGNTSAQVESADKAIPKQDIVKIRVNNDENRAFSNVISSEIKKPIESAKLKAITYFHEPQINYAKFENELDALKKTTIDLLDFSPENEKAKQTFKDVLSKYNYLAEDSIKAMNIDRANVIIDRGLSAASNDASLIELKRRIQGKTVTSVTQKNELKVLFSKAKQHIQKKQFILPLGNNALENYQAILLIEPKNIKAIGQIKKIKSIFEKQIKVNLKGNTFVANSLVNQARALFPYDEKFIQLQQKVKSMVGY